MSQRKNESHTRFKIEIMSQDSVAQTLGIPADKNRWHVVKIARKSLKSLPVATHAYIRSLDGHSEVIYAHDGWLKCIVKAAKL